MSTREPLHVAAYSLFAEYYDLAWADYADYCLEVIQAAEESSLRPFRRVCDAACGTGVLLEGLASAGSESGRTLLGFDRSAAMLRLARTRTAGSAPPVQLKQADLWDAIPFPGLNMSDRIEVEDESTGAASGKVLYVAVRA